MADMLELDRSAGAPGFEVEQQSELTPRASAAEVAGAAEIVGDRYDYLLKYILQ